MLGSRIPAPIRPKMLLVVDLDKTTFNTHKEDKPTWIGSQEYWIKTFFQAQHIARERGFDLVFAIVTNKPTFDDICETAARQLYRFLHFSNPKMYIRSPDGAVHCLARIMGKYYYECLNRAQTTPAPITQNHCSNFIVQGELDLLGQVNKKSSAILDLARVYGIPPQHCILLDDTSSVLEDARANHIRTISFECFNTDPLNPNRIHPDRLEEMDFVWPELEVRRNELFNTVIELAREYENAIVNYCCHPSYTPNYQLSSRTESRFAFARIAERSSTSEAISSSFLTNAQSSASSSSANSQAVVLRVPKHIRPVVGGVSALEALARGASKSAAANAADDDPQVKPKF